MLRASEEQMGRKRGLGEINEWQAQVHVSELSSSYIPAWTVWRHSEASRPWNEPWQESQESVAHICHLLCMNMKALQDSTTQDRT